MLTCEELKDIKNEIKFFLNEITLNKDSVFSSDDADDFLNEFGDTLPFFFTTMLMEKLDLLLFQKIKNM